MTGYSGINKALDDKDSFNLIVKFKFIFPEAIKHNERCQLKLFLLTRVYRTIQSFRRAEHVTVTSLTLFLINLKL